jgi:hypothetical protein
MPMPDSRSVVSSRVKETTSVFLGFFLENISESLSLRHSDFLTGACLRRRRAAVAVVDRLRGVVRGVVVVIASTRSASLQKVW